MSDQEGSEGKMEKKQRYDFIDYLNILACLCVIFMHCNGIVHSFEYSRAWKESMFVEAAAYWAVPVFFMISGATLMGYRDKYSTGTFFKKRVLKTVFPFIAWVLINLIFKTAAGIMEPDLSHGRRIPAVCHPGIPSDGDRAFKETAYRSLYYGMSGICLTVRVYGCLVR